MPHPPPIHVVAQPDGTATYGLWNLGGKDTPLPDLTAVMERIRAEYLARRNQSHQPQESCRG
jgi:hypothetical protein